MHAALSPAALQKLLIDDLEKARKLEELLTEERLQLEKRDAGALDRLLPDKARLLAALEQSDSVRKALLEQSGFTTDGKGLRECCEYLDRQQSDLGREQQAGTLDELGAQLQQQLQYCHELSEINGSIVHRSRSNTQRLLDILRGKTSADAGTYTSSGFSDRQHDRRNLGNV